MEGQVEGESEKNRADRFPPMVKFLGPFTLKEGQTNSHTIQIPRYVGSVKTMVIAGNQRAYGAAEKTTGKTTYVLQPCPVFWGQERRSKCL
jgi:hypothetical protein